MTQRRSMMKVRPARETDLRQLISLSESAGEAAHWSQPQWLDIFHSQSPPRLAWVAEAWVIEDGIEDAIEASAEESHTGDPARAVGFLVAQTGTPEWELENIAVLPECRRQGVARALLSALLSQAHSLLAERILLEVRASNQAAIRLYEASGFRMLARRRDYYRNPPEDAVILAYSFPH